MAGGGSRVWPPRPPPSGSRLTLEHLEGDAEQGDDRGHQDALVEGEPFPDERLLRGVQPGGLHLPLHREALGDWGPPRKTALLGELGRQRALCWGGKGRGTGRRCLHHAGVEKSVMGAESELFGARRHHSILEVSGEKLCLCSRLRCPPSTAGPGRMESRRRNRVGQVDEKLHLCVTELPGDCEEQSSSCHFSMSGWCTGLAGDAGQALGICGHLGPGWPFGGRKGFSCTPTWRPSSAAFHSHLLHSLLLRRSLVHTEWRWLWHPQLRLVQILLRDAKRGPGLL